MCTLQTQISLSLKMATHNLKWSLSTGEKATSIILCPTRPEVCADATKEVLMDTAQDGQGRRAEQLSHFLL